MVDARQSEIGQLDGLAVVFVDDDALWHSFHQVAALVRSHGYRTVRVTTDPTGWLGRLADRLLYDRAVYLSGTGDLANLATLLRSVQVANLHTTESILGAISDGTVDALPEDVAAQLRLRRRFTDKTQAAALASQLDVLVPEQISAWLRPDEAVDKLGLPLVVKTKIGAAGSGVRIANTLEEVEDAVTALGDIDDIYYEQFIRGPIVSYSAMVGAEGVVQELTYEGLHFSSDPTSAPLAYEVIDDVTLTAIGRTVCDGVGLRGPMNLQAIRDDDGNHWVIDLNLRPFGGMLNYEQPSIDTAAGFLYAAGLTDKLPVHRSAPPGLRVTEFPNDAEELARSGHYWAAVQVILRRAPSIIRAFGAKYLAFAMVNGIAYKLGI